MASLSIEDTSFQDLSDYVYNMYIQFEEIESATNDFADENLIAQGGYADIYKGQLSDESEELNNIVARKYVKPMTGDVFINSMTMYKDLKHKNIVSLFKMASGRDFISIHKYETNESLDKHLSGSTLTWMQRLQICVGVAHALRYLHFGLNDDYSVIHGNIKSSKILLDHNWEPKVHDFRCAVKVKRHHIYHSSKYYGTLQYMDPTFETTKGLTHKSDVFSFGVVLFEVLFGMKASIREEDNWYFARMARLHYDEKRLDDMIDGDLRNQMDTQSLALFSETAYFCLNEQRAKRPDMEQIVKRLERALEFHQCFAHPTAMIKGPSADRLKGEHMDHLKVPLSEIKVATENFSERYLIGSGGYGRVYKAILKCLDDTRYVAIKQIVRKGDEHAQQGFVAEIELLSKCKHENIVSLLGFCNEDDEMIIIYEYASNGSLEGYIRKVDKMISFSWAQRIKICLDIARGLLYLHSGIHDENTIIHRDIKSENILLDDKWVAKIADFGLSKLHQGNQNLTTFVTMNIAGTPNYMDPVYEKEGTLKRATDIYSFGVVLLEIICGKLAYDETLNGMGLAEVARQSYKDGSLKNLIDPKIKEDDENIFLLNGGVSQISLDKFSEIAYKCVAEIQNDRPTIEAVIKELEEALYYQEKNKDNLQISLEEINLGTENFNDSKCIREERNWKQYAGEITHANKRTTVIAKRWDTNFPQRRQQFITELQLLYEYKHDNIISLVGYCSEMGENIIVYESMSNGSLDKHLDNYGLRWARRLKICIDVARGLEFLHTSVSVMHMGIKSASILLDGDWTAKISNLELSTPLANMKPIEHITDDNTYGSLVYVSPGDIEGGVLTKESDVYSLGVILKEIWWGRLMDLKDHDEDLYCWDGTRRESITGIMKHDVYFTSVLVFQSIANKCLTTMMMRPKARDVLIGLGKALELQEDFEEWSPKLVGVSSKVTSLARFQMESISDEIMYKDLYDLSSKGMLLEDGKVLVSLGSNSDCNEMISARKFSYKNCRSHKWRSLQESRFQKVAEVFFVSNLNIKINVKTQFLSPGVKYGVHLVFKFCGSRKSSTKPSYVNLTYKMGNETFHAYFATWRDDNWMMIELHRFLKNKEDNDFECLLESFSQCYSGNRAVYVEGVEFRAIDNVNYEEIEKVKESQVLKSSLSNDDMKPSPIWLSKELVKHKRYHVIRMRYKIESQMLSPDTDYACYLVFELSEHCQGLHCPIRVRDTWYGRKKEKRIVYFRSPNPCNLFDGIEVPKMRESGLMEVNVWKFNSCNRSDDYILLSLTLITYEGTMSGLIERGFYIMPME